MCSAACRFSLPADRPMSCSTYTRSGEGLPTPQRRERPFHLPSSSTYNFGARTGDGGEDLAPPQSSAALPTERRQGRLLFTWEYKSGQWKIYLLYYYTVGVGLRRAFWGGSSLCVCVKYYYNVSQLPSPRLHYRIITRAVLMRNREPT